YLLLDCIPHTSGDFSLIIVSGYLHHLPPFLQCSVCLVLAGGCELVPYLSSSLQRVADVDPFHRVELILAKPLVTEDSVAQILLSDEKHFVLHLLHKAGDKQLKELYLRQITPEK